MAILNPKLVADAFELNLLRGKSRAEAIAEIAERTGKTPTRIRQIVKQSQNAPEPNILERARENAGKDLSEKDTAISDGDDEILELSNDVEAIPQQYVRSKSGATPEQIAEARRRIAEKKKKQAHTSSTQAKEEPDEYLLKEIALQKDSTKWKVEAARWKKKFTLIEKQCEVLEERATFKEQIEAYRDRLIIEPSDETGETHEAIAIVQASDWHVGERVDPEKVNWRNKYNPDIAEGAAKLFFKRTLKLVNKERKDVEIRRLILNLGGDIITGHIHEELMETSFCSPLEEAQMAKYFITGGLQKLLDEGDFDEIIIPCNYGNHGRTHQEKKISTGAENSFEWNMYHSIAQEFKNESRLKFIIPRSDFAYIDVFGKTLRFTHGDAIKYGGGIGGIMIPITKSILRWNQDVHADMTMMGHFHQEKVDDQLGITVNNCLIGIGLYALRLGAKPSPALQMMRLLDSKRGFTSALKIYCDDGDRVQKHTSYPALMNNWQAGNVSQSSMKM